MEPATRLLSTAAAKEPGRIGWARGLEGTPFSWADACACYHPGPSVAALRRPSPNAAILEDPRIAHREYARKQARRLEQTDPKRRTPTRPADYPYPAAPKDYQAVPWEPAQEVRPSFSSELCEQVRGHLERWGLLEDAERYGLWPKERSKA